MTDAIPGARYYDGTVDEYFEIVGTYERTVYDEDGSFDGTEVVVDCLYDGHDDPIRVELSLFKNDSTIECVDVPESFTDRE